MMKIYQQLPPLLLVVAMLTYFNPPFPSIFAMFWAAVLNLMSQCVELWNAHLPDLPIDNHVALFVILVNVWGFTVYWLIGAVFSALNFTPLTFLERYRVQPAKNTPTVDPVKFRQTVFHVLFNQIVVGPLFSLATLALVRARSLDYSLETLPTLSEFAIEMIGITLCEEIGFYSAHRLFHESTYLYKQFHKRHHEWTAPVAIAARYAHPVEDVLANVLPIFLGPLVMRSHAFTLFLWLVIALFSTLTAHSGFHFPFMPSSEFHDAHHLWFNTNYGAMGWLDEFFGTNAKFKGSKLEARHRVLLSMRAAREVVPE